MSHETLMSAPTYATAEVFARLIDEGHAVALETTLPGHAAEMYGWDNDLDEPIDHEIGWMAAADMRMEGLIGGHAATVERWVSWHKGQR